MKEACTVVNRFMSIAFQMEPGLIVLLNPRIGLHRNVQNIVGELNHASTLGNFIGGRVWIEDDKGLQWKN